MDIWFRTHHRLKKAHILFVASSSKSAVQKHLYNLSDHEQCSPHKSIERFLFEQILHLRGLDNTTIGREMVLSWQICLPPLPCTKRHKSHRRTKFTAHDDRGDAPIPNANRAWRTHVAGHTPVSSGDRPFRMLFLQKSPRSVIRRSFCYIEQFQRLP